MTVCGTLWLSGFQWVTPLPLSCSWCWSSTSVTPIVTQGFRWQKTSCFRDPWYPQASMWFPHPCDWFIHCLNHEAILIPLLLIGVKQLFGRATSWPHQQLPHRSFLHFMLWGPGHDTHENEDIQLMMISLSLYLDQLVTHALLVSLSSWIDDSRDVSLKQYVTDGHFGKRPEVKEVHYIHFLPPSSVPLVLFSLIDHL